MGYAKLLPEVAFKFLKENVRKKCEFNLDLKLPHFVVPEEGTFERLVWQKSNCSIFQANFIFGSQYRKNYWMDFNKSKII